MEQFVDESVNYEITDVKPDENNGVDGNPLHHISFDEPHTRSEYVAYKENHDPGQVENCVEGDMASSRRLTTLEVHDTNQPQRHDADYQTMEMHNDDNSEKCPDFTSEAGQSTPCAELTVCDNSVTVDTNDGATGVQGHLQTIEVASQMLDCDTYIRDNSHNKRRHKRKKKLHRHEKNSDTREEANETKEHAGTGDYADEHAMSPYNLPAMAMLEPMDLEHTANKCHNDYSATNETIYPVQKTPKRKKKLRIRDLSLKKTTSKVGIAPLPDIAGAGMTLTPDLLPVIHEYRKQTALPSIGRGNDISEKARVGDSDEFTQVLLPEPPKGRGAGDEGTPSTTTHPEPLKLCLLITRYPVLSFLIASLGHIATFVGTAVLVTTGHDVFPLVFEELPLLLFNDVRLRQLSWTEKTFHDDYVYRPVYGTDVPYWYRGQVKDVVEVIFEIPGGNLLDHTHLKWIEMAENRLFDSSTYKKYFCTVNKYYQCLKPKSLLRFFDGTYSYVDPVFDDKNFTNVNDVIYKASVYNETKETLSLFVGKNAYIQPDGCRTSITRSIFLMGWPLNKMANGKAGTLDDLENFLVENFKRDIEHVRDEVLVDVMDVYYLSKVMLERDLVLQVYQDVKLAIGSFLFILCFMTLQTGSLTVTLLGILSILSSFLLTNLIYRYVFQFIYFGFFHVITIFLILGIGADDLFVFYDTWRLTGHTSYPSDAHRLSDCYRRAAKTTFVTSVTTMVAFLVSGLSPLLPVKTFGIFAGLLVAINYVWVILYFPTIIILHHTKIKNTWYNFHSRLLKVCVAKCSIKNSVRSNSVSVNSLNSHDNGVISSNSSSTQLLFVTDESKNETSYIGDLLGKENKGFGNTAIFGIKDKNEGMNAKLLSELQTFKNVENDTPAFTKSNESLADGLNGTIASTHHNNIEDKKEKEKKNFEDRNKVVMFLKNGFYDFATKRGAKIVVPLLLIGVTVFFIHRATLIEPSTHQLGLFREGHNYAVATKKHYFSFMQNHEDEYVRLHMVWGMREADISACNLKSAEFCPGVTQWDEDFDMNTPEAQGSFKQLCERLETMDDGAADSLNIRRDPVTGKRQIACFVKPFEEFMKKEYVGNPKYSSNMSLELPVTPGNVSYFMQKNSYFYSKDLGQNFTNYFEIPISYWLSNGYSAKATADYFMYNMLLGEHMIPGVTKPIYWMYYGTKLSYVAIEVNTTMNLYSLGYKEGMPIYQRWEKLMADINAEMPFPLQRGFQVTKDLWHWIHVQETLANSAVTGIIVGLLSALPLLILTTCNVIIGTLAAFTIGMVTACVVGLIPLIGWQLGVLESINLCMVVGLSVDYIVHMAEAYHMSRSYRRHDRVRDMLESIGLSVLSGAITTMGAAAFMLFAQIQFLFEFGIFIISTVGISLVFSLFGFTTFLALCGPEGHTGSLNKLFHNILRRLNCAKAPNGSGSDESPDEAGCVCATPSVIIDRCFDRLGYRN